jgi:hypothetical protein
MRALRRKGIDGMSGSANWTEDQYQEYLRGRSVVVTSMRPSAVVRSSHPDTAPPQRTPKPRGMNKWETAFADHLELRKRSGEIDWYGFEAIKIRLAKGANFTPDFAVLHSGELAIYEVKGHWREAALVRFKVAAENIPVPFYAVSKANNGEWEVIRSLNV